MFESVEQWADNLESAAVDLVAKIAPWAAPAPTAYLVFARTTYYLAWPWWVGALAALVIESLGLAVTSTALTLYRYNVGKRKADPPAPLALPLALVGLYFGSAELLTVALDVAPKLAAGLAVSLADWAPAVFPVLSLAGVTVLAIRADHRRRLGEVAAKKAEKSGGGPKRPAQDVHILTAHDVVVPGPQSAHGSAQYGVLDAVNRTRQARREALLGTLLDAYRGDPHLGATEAARLLGVHRNTVYNYTDELETAGRVRKNGNGVEVLQ